MVVEFKPKKKLSETEKKEKRRAKKIYDSFQKRKAAGKPYELDEITAEFLKKYGYEL